MAATLVIIGLTLFLMGSVMLGRDAAERGRNTLLFVLPFIGFSYTRHHWSDVWWMAMLRVFGGTTLLIGIGIALAQNPGLIKEPESLLQESAGPVIMGSKRPEMNTFANSEEAILLAIRHDNNPVLTGSIHGAPFVYDRVQIIDDVISIQQGDGLIPDREVRILMDLGIEGVTARETWYVQPADEQPPEVHLSWRESAQSHPETRVINAGYRLELQLARIGKDQFKGFLQLLLPDEHNSFLSGEFVANTNRLRYIDGKVDVTFDHDDTLEFVAERYLETQFPEGAMKSVRFQDTGLKIGAGEGGTTAIVELSNGQVEQRDMLLDRSEVGWSVRPGSMTTTILQGPQSANLRLVARDGQTGGAGDQQEAAIKPRLLPRDQLDSLVGQEMTLSLVDGKDHLGILKEVRRDRARLEKLLDAGGVIQAWIQVADIRALLLKGGQPVVLVDAEVEAGPEPAGQEAEPGETVSEPPSEAAPETAPVADVAAEPASAPAPDDLSRYLNREVKIRDQQGRERQGLVTAVSKVKLTLRVQVGSGSLNYYYGPKEIASIELLENR